MNKRALGLILLFFAGMFGFLATRLFAIDVLGFAVAISGTISLFIGSMVGLFYKE